MTSPARDDTKPGNLPGERQLFTLAQNGNRDAFRALYQHHQIPVYWAAYSVLHSKDDAEEIVTDTFMTMWMKKSSINLVSESSLPWLVTTARFLAMNRRRSEIRLRHTPLDDDKEIPDDSPTPEDEATTQESLANIQAVMVSMPVVDQEIFQLCLLQDLTYKQAAHSLGITHSTVRNRLSRLKFRLRSELELLKRGH